MGARHIGTIKASGLETFNAAMRSKPKADGQSRSETSMLGVYNHQLIPFNPCVAAARLNADHKGRFLSIEEVNALAFQLPARPSFDLLMRFAALT